MAIPPTVAEFKAYFVREFQYDKGLNFVTDDDIQRAISESFQLYNQSLIDDAGSQNVAYLYVIAHVLVVNIQNAGGLAAKPLGLGVRNVADGVMVSKGIGPANVTYQVPPDRISRSPTLLYFFQTSFGQRYIQMIANQLNGQMLIACGPNQVVQWSQE